MKIAYLCDKEHYLKKMSRVRFHSMEAIEKMSSAKRIKLVSFTSGSDMTECTKIVQICGSLGERH